MNKLKRILIIFVWLLIWEIAAICIHNQILFAGPVDVIRKLLALVVTVDFYRICLLSLGRILLGFLIAFIFGVILGGLSYRYSFLKDFLDPILAVIKSIPVASFVVLLLIWQGSNHLSIWISFFVVFPNVCVATRTGFSSVDEKLLEMAKVFKLSHFKKILYVYRPAVLPYILACLEISIGMSFKSGVAAEVIGTPDYSIGERIYVSKVYLDTPSLFAWTIALIFLSYLVEKGILFFVKQLERPRTVLTKKYGDIPLGASEKEDNASDKVAEDNDSDKGAEDSNINTDSINANKEQSLSIAPSYIEMQGLKKTYGDKLVIRDFSAKLEKGKIYMLMGPSGYGKTTLMRVLAGLEPADEGNITGVHHVTYQFQEDRLFEKEYTLNNILLPSMESLFLGTGQMGNQIEKNGFDFSLLPEECLEKQVETLSGGMKRRTSLMRGMFYQMDKKEGVCFLDEPFSGMDEETKKKAMQFIKKYQNDRTVIIATHDESDVKRMGGILWKPELR